MTIAQLAEVLFALACIGAGVLLVRYSIKKGDGVPEL